jgi:hypothetical protein
MAVSLVSTGVQFPDSTIQTTAATASSPPGLVLVSAVTPTVSSTIAFTFSSSYDNYFLVLDNIVSATGSPSLAVQVAVGGTLQTTGYWTGGNFAQVDPGTANYSANRGAWNLTTSPVDSVNANRNMFGIYWFQNVNATGTSVKNMFGQSVVYYSGPTGANFYGSLNGGAYENSSALSGMTLYWSGGQNFAARGTAKLYGYKN